jgi:hypothetical protein
MCLYVRHPDPVARSGVDTDGEWWLKLNVALNIYTFLARLVAMGWFMGPFAKQPLPVELAS